MNKREILCVFGVIFYFFVIIAVTLAVENHNTLGVYEVGDRKVRVMRGEYLAVGTSIYPYTIKMKNGKIMATYRMITRWGLIMITSTATVEDQILYKKFFKT